MNRREKILALAVAILVLALVLNFGAARIARMFTELDDTKTKLEEDLKTKELMKHRGVVARRLLDVYQERSLPSDKTLASTRYRDWLFEWVKQANIKAANVKHVMVRPFRDAHERHTFSVTCAAELPQLVQLLYTFYSTDYLHRIKHMSAKPLEGKTLALAFTIEAIAMPDAPANKELGDMPADRLVFDKIDDYLHVIIARNLYSPANQPPKLAAAGTQQGFLNQRMSFSLKADDPEKNRITYRLGEGHPDGMTIDESAGRVEWTPSEKGEFDVLVYAVDDGLPPKESSQTVQLEVTDPPPPEVPPPARPAFDDAKYTFVTGIVEVNGRRQVWLTIRTQGKWLRLFEGETFQVGAFEGKVIKIHPRHVEIESADTLLSVRYGQSINEGAVLREGKVDVAATGQ